MPSFDEEAFKSEIIRRAVLEPAFRAALQADPKGTLEAALGKPLPDNVAVEVLQEQPQKIYLVLPLAVAEAESAPPSDQPLPDDELDQISGGRVMDPLSFRHDGALNRALNRRRR